MDETDATEELLSFFKALSNVDRLKIVGSLAAEPRSLEEIGSFLRLPVASTYKHLSYLEKMGLAVREGERYRLDASALEEMARRILAHSRLRVSPEDFDGEAYERKILSDFFQPDGRLKSFPAQQKKWMVVLRYISRIFKPGVRYQEKEVNELLKRYHEDTASLRRAMVDNGLLTRKAGEYWQLEV